MQTGRNKTDKQTDKKAAAAEVGGEEDAKSV